VAWTGAEIRPRRWLASGGARPRRDLAGEAASERWGTATRGLRERRWLRPAEKIEW
jgi:hypothetical protein